MSENLGWMETLYWKSFIYAVQVARFLLFRTLRNWSERWSKEK